MNNFTYRSNKKSHSQYSSHVVLCINIKKKKKLIIQLPNDRNWMEDQSWEAPCPTCLYSHRFGSFEITDEFYESSCRVDLGASFIRNGSHHRRHLVVFYHINFSIVDRIKCFKISQHGKCPTLLYLSFVNFDLFFVKFQIYIVQKAKWVYESLLMEERMSELLLDSIEKRKPPLNFEPSIRAL